MTNECGIFLS